MSEHEDERRASERREDDRRIWMALDEIRQRVTALDTKEGESRQLLEEVRRDVKEIIVKGCSRAHCHDDHEDRLRLLETGANVRTGAATVIGVLAGSIISAVMHFLKGGGK